MVRFFHVRAHLYVSNTWQVLADHTDEDGVTLQNTHV